MAWQKVVRTLDPETAAYIAGLVDGEGTITLSADHRGERRNIVVSISNNDRTLLEFINSAIEAGCITAKRTYQENHSPSYTYKIAGRQALHLLAQIARYLKTYRAARARMALDRYIAVTPRNGKYSPDTARMKEEFEREFLALGPGPRSGDRARNRQK